MYLISLIALCGLIVTVFISIAQVGGSGDKDLSYDMVELQTSPTATKELPKVIDLSKTVTKDENLSRSRSTQVKKLKSHTLDVNRVSKSLLPAPHSKEVRNTEKSSLFDERTDQLLVSKLVSLNYQMPTANYSIDPLEIIREDTENHVNGLDVNSIAVNISEGESRFTQDSTSISIDQNLIQKILEDQEGTIENNYINEQYERDVFLELSKGSNQNLPFKIMRKPNEIKGLTDDFILNDEIMFKLNKSE